MQNKDSPNTNILAISLLIIRDLVNAPAKQNKTGKKTPHEKFPGEVVV
jgi:hypothetical protein